MATAEVEMSFEDQYHAIHFLMYCAALAYHYRCAWVFSIGFRCLRSMSPDILEKSGSTNLLV